MNMATAASFCSAIIPREKYDVFLSFRGEDTRNTFTSHFYEALCRNKIQTYIDYKLERGDEISPALLKAISKSKLSVIIFSKNYASSTWCLDELVHILQCRGGQFVIPIFYGIDPSHVRKQSGCYEDAFLEHEERFKDSMDKVRIWRVALTTAANISGYDSQTIRLESELVKLVVNDILAKLNCKSQIASGLEGLVGIEKHIQQVELLLCLDSLDVQIVGIWGMGGIGKTTIADVVFHRLSSQFEACCFIANVRDASETKHGLNDLRNQLFGTILKEENLYMAAPSIGSSFARERLRCTRALVVLDDVIDLGQVEYLTGGYRNLFGPGSRIIITSRNKRTFGNGLDDGKIYEVKKLDYDEALVLFHLRANISFPGDYTTFAKQVVDYAGGNPLALTMLGSLFSHCRSKEDWEGELDKVKKFPNRNIQNILGLSYDGLHQNEKDIFLDIACFYKGEDIDYTKRMLDASGFCVNAGIRLLIDMSLISINSNSSRLEMHDLIQEMGQTIVLDECIKDPGQRSRLWIAKDISCVLKHKTGTQAIECLVMNMDHISELDIEPSAFKKMHYLRLLKFKSYWNSKCVNLPQGLKCLPQALRILQWDGYPLNSLPSKFCPENLVELRMPFSRLERLWTKGLKINLGSLERIDLTWSKHLAEVPDLSESPNLERINLSGCTSLVQLPSSFQHLAKLTSLYLGRCSNLKVLPEMPGNLEVLQLSETAIEELPSSIWCLEKLNVLDLGQCEKLKTLPSSTCRLNSLQSLYLYGCLSLESLPVELPSGLKKLQVKDCKSLGSLPVELPSGLKELQVKDCKSLRSLPVELPSGLLELDLRNCKSLRSLPVELPSGLLELELRNCESLRSLPVKLPSGLLELDLGNCESLRSLPVELPSGLKKLTLINCESLRSLPVKLPPGLLELELRNCKRLGSLPVELPPGLQYLDLSNCKRLGSLPVELPYWLQYLDLGNCKSLGSLPKLPWLLQKLDARGCTSLETVSSSMRTAPGQGNEGIDQYVDNDEDVEEELLFINCVKLDQNARSNIMADAQLRVMRYATAFKLGWAREVIKIVCPGNEIPKWLRYQSEGCSINIKLPPHSFCQGFLGYVVCVVVAFNNYTPPPNIGNSYFLCQAHHKTNNGHKDWCKTLYIRLRDDIIPNSDHVFLWYLGPHLVRSESTINRKDWVKASEASFDFMLYHSTCASRKKYPLDLSTVRVKRCGVSLLYAQDFEKLVEGIDEDVVMEPKQVVESGAAILKEEDDGELLPQSSKRQINMF